MTSPLRQVPHAIEHAEQLDQLAKPLAKAAQQAIPNGPIKDLLSGTWIGHPLHPILTDVVIGAWVGAGALDWLAGRHANKAAQRLVGLGCLAAVPTAAAGLNDFMDLWGEPQRVGLVHAAGNVVALFFNSLSWLARRRGNHLKGRFLALIGMGAGVGSAYLGGHLSFGKGVGVNQTVFDEPPARWRPVMDATDLPEGKLVEARDGNVGIVLYRHDGRIDVLHNRCSHRGCPLSDGKVEGDVLVCPCHGSAFRLSTGEIVQGPATAPQPAFDARIENGKVEVRPRP